MEHGSAFLIGALIGLVIGLLIGGSVGALILMLATRIVEKFVPRFWLAFGTVLASTIVSLILNFFVGLFLGAAARAAGLQAATIKLISFPLGAVIGFLIGSVFIRAMIKRPDGSRLGYGRACQVALLQTVFGLVLLAIVYGGLYWLRHAMGLEAATPVSM